MIKIEDTEVMGIEGALRGMRNPLASHKRGDSKYALMNEEDVACGEEPIYEFIVGPNDEGLMKRLCKAGNEHRKYLRMIHVQCDITAPLYWVAEHDTYKISTTRNSYSFMHKGVSKPFTINDFSISDNRITYLLNPLEVKHYDLVYPYETEEYKIYTTNTGRDYKVFRNGRVFACEFSYVDNYGTGRRRHFEEKECKPSETKCGYYELNIGGRGGEKWQLHRLIATCWLDNPNMLETVDHINGNKGDNSVENLQWCSRGQNVQKAFKEGVYKENTLHRSYAAWKNGFININPFDKQQIIKRYKNGESYDNLSAQYDLTKQQINNVLYGNCSENEELFISAYTWERVIEALNELRSCYLETKDENIFQAIRQLLPQGYNVKYTWDANYETLINIYKQRFNHRLPEWHIFCDWVKELPCMNDLIEALETPNVVE